jgi:CheY-like chemotaxis protein
MRLKILVVEDDPTRVELFHEWLADDDTLYVTKTAPAIQCVNEVRCCQRLFGPDFGELIRGFRDRLEGKEIR